jgi:hypothetical protein
MEFNSQIESVIADEGEKALSYYWLHSKSQKKFSRLSNLINIPVIILSTLAGASSIGSESLFQGFPQASVIIGLVSIIVGILSTLQSYFNFEKTAESHRISSIQYYKVYNFIKIELSLPRHQRTKMEDFLKIIKEDLERLKEISPLIPDGVIKEYKLNFNIEDYKEISKPEICNGLSQIEPYSQEVESKRQSLKLEIEKLDTYPTSENFELKTEIKDIKVKLPETKPWK